MTEVHLQGNPANRYFKLGPIQARRLGLAPMPDGGDALYLMEGADPDARLILPNGVDFTARELTMLANKSGNPMEGWEVWADDPGGWPLSSPVDNPDEYPGHVPWH